MGPVSALGISALVAAGAFSARALTGGGAVAAWLIGAAVLYGTGWGGGAMLAAFFVSSTVVGRVAVLRSVAADPAGERRDARQVLANGAAAAAGALLERLWPGLGLWIACGALATAGADTWATSIGAFSGTDPRHLLTLRHVPKGTSGGLSLVGTLSALAGAAIVAVPGGLAGGGVPLLMAGTGIGFGGMLLDSLLGATLQSRSECPRCGIATESAQHCGTPTRRVGGSRWLDNDGVNALSTTLAALAAAGAWGAWAG